MELKTFFTQQSDGPSLSKATVYIYEWGTSRLAQGLKDEYNGELKNPFDSTNEGLIRFSAPNGKYEMYVRSQTLEQRLQIQFFDINEAGSLTVITATGVQNLDEALNHRIIHLKSMTSLATLNTEKMISGQTVNVGNELIDDQTTGGEFYWAAESTDPEDGGLVFGNASSGRFKRRCQGAVYSEWYGLKDSLTEDQTTKFLAAKQAAENLGVPLYLSSIRFVISETSIIKSRSMSWIEGLSSHRRTEIIFRNDPKRGGTLGKNAFLYDGPSSGSMMRNIQIRDEVAGSSVGIAISSSLAVGTPNWKNFFERVELRDFRIGAMTTTANPFDGSTHGWASETLYFNCKFRNCQTSFLNNNLQAVNTTFLDSDMENDVSNEKYTLIRDEAGGEIKVIGGSYIGRGLFYSWCYPESAKNLWYSGKITFQSSRWECRSAGYGRSVCKEDYSTRANYSRALNLTLNDIQINSGGKEIDLLHYAGKINATLQNVIFSYGSGVIRQHPTFNLSANPDQGGMSSVFAHNCAGLRYERESSTPYHGAYDQKLTGSVEISSPHASTGGAYKKDNDNFIYNESSSYTEFGYGLSEGLTEKILTYGKNDATSEFKEIKLKLPKYARITKFWAYKQPFRMAKKSTLLLYAVKDKEQWKNREFNTDSDATLISRIEINPRQAGYFEATIILVDNIFGESFQSGIDHWLEGRLYIKSLSKNATFTGWLGVKYL
ncbi:hypothetical protein [Modicisalibacter radicis]|uniref:hypothetical protein n=1 Tax=Halomonas sp. EAR18 TaxID=2518972 RepID=UPI00109CF27F|nr:hypothetical protein [Halomonas sp. EAR18]